MRGRAAAVEQAGLGEQERAGAHRGQPPDARGWRAQPRDQLAILPSAASVPMPPQTISVSMRAWVVNARRATSSMPDDIATGPALRATTSTLIARLVGAPFVAQPGARRARRPRAAR